MFYSDLYCIEFHRIGLSVICTVNNSSIGTADIIFDIEDSMRRLVEFDPTVLVR